MFLSRARAAIIPRPLQSEESLTSWFVRVARANAMSQHELGSVLLGKTVHGVTKIDLDLSGSELFDALASRCGTSWVEARLASLQGWVGFFADSRPSRSRTARWVLDRRRIGYKHRVGAWTQACPRCLAADEQPFFRNVWRLAFVTECLVHHVKLIDRCPRCRAPLDFACETDSTRKELTDLSQCPQCRCDWREAATSASQEQVATLQGRLVHAISERWVAVENSAVALPLYLDGIFRLQRLLRRSVGHKLRLAIYRAAGFDVEVKDSSVPFESLSVEERRSEWEAIAALLDSWPTQFVSIGRAVELRWSDITEERTAHVPFWLERVGREHFDRTWYRPSAGEMVSVRTFLDTYGLSSRPTLVREWTGGWVQVRRVSIAPVPIDAPEQLRLPMIDASGYRQQVQRVWIQRLVKSLRRYCLHSFRKPPSLSRWNCTQLELPQVCV